MKTVILEGCVESEEEGVGVQSGVVLVDEERVHRDITAGRVPETHGGGCGWVSGWVCGVVKEKGRGKKITTKTRGWETCVDYCVCKCMKSRDM